MKTKVDKLDDVIKNIKLMTKKEVVIGIPQAKARRKGEPIDNATIAYINEYGSPKQNIPARPFLRPGVKAATQKNIKILKDAAKKGDPKSIEKGLIAAGLNSVSSVKGYIIAQTNFAPLSPVTIAARERIGFSGTKALIHTGQLLNSITFVIRDKK